MKKILSAIAMFLFFAVGALAQKVTFVLDWTPNTNHTGVYVAKDLGYYKEEGIDLDIVQPSDDSSAVIVGTGKADFGVYFQPNMIGKLKKGVPITAIAAIIQHNTAGLMSLRRPDVKGPKDLAKLKYGSWDDAIDDETASEVVGVKSVADLNKVPYGDFSDQVGAMRAGAFDYAINYYGWEGIDANLKGVPIDFYFLRDYDKALDYYTPVIITNNNLIKQNPELVRKFLRATKKGYEYAIKNPVAAAKILFKMAPEGNEKLDIASQRYLSARYAPDGDWGRFDLKRWDAFYNWVYEHKLSDKPFPHSYGVTNDFLPR